MEWSAIEQVNQTRHVGIYDKQDFCKMYIDSREEL